MKIKDIDINPENETVACATTILPSEKQNRTGRKLYVESYGCQMNFSDSEIIASILKDVGFEVTSEVDAADVIFLNTCSIREKAEQTVRNRLHQLQTLKKNKPDRIIGILGCMAERLKTKLLDEEKAVDIIAGPDAYRDLPALIHQADHGEKAVNTFLSREETYADIEPVRLNSNGISAFISIMRGCDNMCSFCVVPFTRGRERSRKPESILQEIETLSHKGYKEVTLLGQNVDSYKWSENDRIVHFANLLDMTASAYPTIRIRFSTSHPKDITDDVLYTMAKHENICKYIHLPVQSGSSRVLSLMNRGYTRAWYLKKIERIREILGEDCGLSSDIIAGFCTETEEEHQETLSLMELVQFDYSFMFAYSERPGTLAERKLKDDVPLAMKKQRLNEIISLQTKHSLIRNQRDIGKVHQVLIEGNSRRSDEHWQGRNTQNKVIIFPKESSKKGTLVNVLVDDCTGATLFGKIID